MRKSLVEHKGEHHQSKQKKEENIVIYRESRHETESKVI